MPDTTQDPGKVPVGTTSKAGYGVTALGVVAALVAYIAGDHSTQTLGVLAAGGLAALAFVSTQIGRFMQSHAKIRAAAAERIASPAISTELVDLIANRSANRTMTALGLNGTVGRSGSLDAQAQMAHDETVANHGIDDDKPDPFDGVPDVPVTAPGNVGEDQGDPLSRGEVDDVTAEAPEPGAVA